MVNHLGDTVQHRAKGSCKEAHDGSSSQELFFAFGKDIGIWQVSSCSQSPRVLLAKLCLDVGDGVGDEVTGTVLQLLEDQGVGECR